MEPRRATVTQCVVRVDDPAIGLRPVGDRPLLSWLLREFTRFGVTDFLLLSEQGLADRVSAEQMLTGQALMDIAISLPRQATITVSRTPAGAGTGGGLFHARDQLEDRFLLCDGETLFDWNLATLLAGAAADEPGTIGRLALNDGAMNGVIGLFRKELVEYLRPVCSLEAGVLPDLAKRGLLEHFYPDWKGGIYPPPSWPGLSGPSLAAHAATGGPDKPGHDGNSWPWRDSCQPENAPASSTHVTPGDDVAHAGGDFPARLRRNALFLDRDGVINIDHGYVGSHDRFEWVDGALDAIRYATQAGWHVFIVTNQSGVARGLYSEDAVRHLLDWIGDQARAAGGTIDDVRFCPFHPEAPLDAFRQAHPWRKPLPGMLLDLIDAWELDPNRAVMVGDQDSDMQAAAAAGVTGYLFPGGNLLAFLQPILDRHAMRRVA